MNQNTQKQNKKFKIRKGDTVTVISGKDRGKTGKVLRVLTATDKVLVEGIFMRKRHQRARRAGQKGEVVSLPTPIHSSNVLFLCKNCGKGVRIGWVISGQKKARICKRCKKEI